MKIGTITSTNSKGQVVIPKKIRQALAIDEDSTLNITMFGGGVYIQPIETVLPKTTTPETSYLKLLAHTKGAWKTDSWKSTHNKRSKIEQTASKSRKQSW